MKLRKSEVQKDEVQERLSGRSKKVKLSKNKMQKGKVQEKVKYKKGEVQEGSSARRVKCKKGEVQGRLRTDWVGGMHPKHALECLRHGADLSCQRQGSAPGPWKASCKGRFIFDRFAFEFLRFFAKGVVEKKEILCKSLRKE